MLPFFAVMGIGKSQDNFDFTNIVQENSNRKYKITKIDPMNSNIAFVLYKCTGNSGMPKYTLRAFHNEELIKTDGCRSKTSCSLEEFVNYFSFFTNICGSTRDACKASN